MPRIFNIIQRRTSLRIIVKCVCNSIIVFRLIVDQTARQFGTLLFCVCIFYCCWCFRYNQILHSCDNNQNKQNKKHEFHLYSKKKIIFHYESPDAFSVASIDDPDLAGIPLDDYKKINESLEFKCTFAGEVEKLTESEHSRFCLTHWDSILCWPKTVRGVVAYLPCPAEFQGVHYDITKNASRRCHFDGQWDNYTHYDLCQHLQPTVVPEFDAGIELPTLVYYTGYTISLVSLTLAVAVFLYFKDLRCLRNTIHANLFITHILSALLWILLLTLSLQIEPSAVGCVLLVTFFHYFSLTNFFWMLVEGLYLYMLVVETFSGDNLKFHMYALIGWGGPAVFVLSWAIIKAFAVEPKNLSVDGLQIECTWMRETNLDWIFQGPACAVILINLIFLFRIMWVLITKLRSANTVETRQYRKASKALLVLIPLLGITYLVVLAGPNEGVGSTIFFVARAFLLSTQGFFVSLFYCFLNSEVRTTLRHRFNTWKDERNIRIGQTRQSRRPLTSYNKRESCASSATTTTLLGPPSSNYASQRGSNGALHLYAMPRAISPLMQQGLDENCV
ncbi:diuretic hormone receptor-like isoform X2 [Contarinia nasturtii]|uniref:diuretic hormone receptor-like isoform X2 n=1 Tax=Contarinia nasturtii TaxID=265458 RepID=UPI0012D3FF3A|nr:diuretic hormone receptor-like isoform X2 [Contarinia nasturtii]